MLHYPFSLVRAALKNIGFEPDDSDSDKMLLFCHNETKKLMVIGVAKELGLSYLQGKMKEIDLPFEYFDALTETVKRLSDNS